MRPLSTFLFASILLALPFSIAIGAPLEDGDVDHIGVPQAAAMSTASDMPASPADGGAFNAEIAKSEAELAKKMQPFAGGYGAGFRDKNDVSVMQGGVYGGGTLWDALNLRLQAMTGLLHQDAKSSRRESNVWRTSTSLGFVDLFLTPRIVFWGGFQYEGFNQLSDEDVSVRDASGNTKLYSRTPLYRGYVVGGKLGAKYIFDNESEVGVEAKRESMWSEHDRFDTRVFNRITDMTKMASDMAVNRVRAYSNIVTFPENQLHLEGGYDSMEDGNQRKWGYAHYQLPFPWSYDKHWMVLRPNLYVESCDEQKDGYFSPEYHITMGLMVHTIQEFKHIDIEAEVNPQLLWTKDKTKKGDTQEGIHGLLNIAYKYENFRIGVGGFAYSDTDNYWLLRGNVFLKYSF